MLAHGAVLRKNGLSAEELEAVALDFHGAGLEEEVLMMKYAQKVVGNAVSTTQKGLDDLRRVGCTDEDILTTTLTASARSFASKVFDALSHDADGIYAQLDKATHHALIGTRPFAP